MSAPAGPLSAAPRGRPATGAPVVLVPRPEGRGDGLRDALAGHGLRAELSPMVGFEPSPASELHEQLDQLAAGAFTHLAITSRTTVDVLRAVRDPLPLPAGTAVLAVGGTTARALAAAGAAPTLIASGSGAALVAEAPDPRGAARLWLPASSAAADTVRQGLVERGYTVTQTIAYRPRVLEQPPHVLAALREGGYAAVVLTSPMIAREIAARGPHPGTVLLSIGEPTTAALREAGLPVHGQAAQPTDAALAAAVAAALAGPAPRGDVTAPP